MAEAGGVDTSSYPRPASLPVQKSPLDIAGQLGGLQVQQQQIQRNAIGIDQSKLQLMNDRFQLVSKKLMSLRNNPNLSADDIVNESQDALKEGLSSPEMHAQFVSEIPSKTAIQRKTGLQGSQLDQAYANTLRAWIDKKHIQAEDTVAAVNHVYGAPGVDENGQTRTPTRQFLTGPPVAAGAPIQQQAPPTTPTMTPQGQQLLGPQSPQVPPNSLPVQGGLPGQYQPTPQSGLPIAQRQNLGPPTTDRQPAQATDNFDQRFNGAPHATGPVTGLAPGVVEAAQKTGIASGEQLANARQHAASFQREVFPLEQAIPALEKLGTKGTGPGTETINHIKSFVLSNVPGVKSSDFNGTVKDYDTAHKYLIDFVNQTGSSGTNDKLAAAFSGNPNTHMSNAAALDVAKSALALRRMQQAQILQFEKTGLSDDKFAKWAVQNTNSLDARAFGVDLMSKEARTKLRAQLNKNKKESDRFEASLQLAHDANFITPSGH